MKILAGVYQPDAGEILIGWLPCACFRDRADALGHGIAMIYQELVACGSPHGGRQHTFLGREPLALAPLKVNQPSARSTNAPREC
jgi:ribose transport system ATP-binding protein